MKGAFIKIMEKTRKNLKISSIIVLAFAGVSFFEILFGLFFGEFNEALNSAAIPEGSPENIVLITQIFILVVSFLLLLPHAYIGIKGLKIAKSPDSSRGHIIWGIILIVLTAIGLISPFLALVQGNGKAFDNIADLCSITVDVFILYEYIRYAIAVRNGN